MSYYTIGQFSKLVGKSIQTLRQWHTEGKLKPHHVSEGVHRYYSEQQIYQVIQQPLKTNERKTIGYCRVSSNKQKDDLERQIESVKAYMIAKGYSFDIITDIGSGINYSKKGLNQLINMITNYEAERIVVLYKDRLLRFGFELVENLCKKYNTTIEIIDQTEKTGEQELVEDLVQIITVFSCRLQGKRANKAKKLIKELLANDNGKKS